MINTVDFKTKTIFLDRENPCKKDVFVLGIDIGYSAVKGMSPNKVFCFPSYAKKIPADRITLREPRESDILYRDGNSVWAVGEMAYNEVNPSEVLDSEEELFGRNRYYTSMFTVIARTAYGIGMLENQYGDFKDKHIRVQTGLPPKYEKSDTPYLKDALSGHHEFELKVGKRPWLKFVVDINENDIGVMSQPLGSLLSVCMDSNGNQLPKARELFSTNLIVYDPGFGTMDEYTVKHGSVTGYETFSNLGMREIFSRTVREIQMIYGTDIQIPELQNKLERGTIKMVDRKAMTSKSFSIAGILEKHMTDVAEENIKKLISVNNYFEDINVIIVTGGLGDCFMDIIRERLEGFEDLKIISANENDPSLTNVFSNVRGYYFYRANSK